MSNRFKVFITCEGQMLTYEIKGGGDVSVGSGSSDNILIPWMIANELTFSFTQNELKVFISKQHMHYRVAYGETLRLDLDDKLTIVAFIIEDIKKCIIRNGTYPSITVGSSVDNSVSVANKYISRKHAAVDLNSLILTDYNSTNGTYLNGKRVRGSQQMRPGDTVVIMPLQISICVDCLELVSFGAKPVITDKGSSVDLISGESPRNSPPEFERSPRITNKLTGKTITIQSPPGKGSKQPFNWVSILAPFLSFGAIAAAMIVTVPAPSRLRAELKIRLALLNALKSMVSEAALPFAA